MHAAVEETQHCALRRATCPTPSQSDLTSLWPFQASPVLFVPLPVLPDTTEHLGKLFIVLCAISATLLVKCVVTCSLCETED